MDFTMKKILLALSLIPVLTAAHTLTPQRFYTPNTGNVHVQLKASTYAAAVYVPEVYYAGVPEVSNDLVKGLDHPIEFSTNREKMILRNNGSAQFRIQFDAKEKGIYLVCTLKQGDVDSSLNTRVCARIGVGMEPNLNK